MLIEFVRRYRLWVAAALLLLAVDLAVFFAMTLPKINAEAISRERLERLLLRQEELRGRLDGRLAARRALREGREGLERFHGEILGSRGGRLVAILEQSESIARRYGMQPQRVRFPSARVQDQPLERFAMSFPLQGSYDSLRRFVDAVESSTSFLIVDEVLLEGSPGGGREQTMRITVSTYFRNPVASVEGGS